MKSPKLSIIIINFNTPAITSECMRSVIKNTRKIDYEIILVDNGSRDESYKLLNTEFGKLENVKVLKSDKNLGFSKGNNLGITKSKGEYILLLNSDTQVHDNLLYEMTNWLDKNKEVGIATCALLNQDGSMQGTGGYFPNLLRVTSWMTIEDIPFVDRLIKPFHPHRAKSFQKNDRFYTMKRQIDWVTGAFLLTRRKVVEQIGMLDEDYFMYTEDTDFCFRAKKAGWEIYYLPQWKITHLGGQSSNKEFPILSEFKSLKLFYKKHYPSWQLPIVRLLLKIGSLWRSAVFGVLYGKEAMQTYAKAFRES